MPAALATALADRYRLERKLGEGGMATVFLAEDLRHDRQVAIKLLRPELAAVIGAERFLAEIKTTAKLQHAHILPLFDSGEASGQLFYVMPYVEGESLRDRLVREKQLPIADAVRIAGEVASALDYAHKQGVIHRDIKPENIMLSGGHALVADFGIALAASKAGGNRMTETGLSLGTPHYMSPEQATAERELDARSDVYALGCVLYEMLAGEPPFTGPSTQAIIARLMTEEARPLGVVRRAVPPHVEAAVACALEKLAADRFATAGEFGAAIAGMGGTLTATTASRVRGVKPAGSPRLTAALGGLALLGFALAAWGWLRPAPEMPVRRYGVALPAGEALMPPVGGGRLALSPDGKRIAYVGPGPSGSQLWLRELDQLHGRPVPGTDLAFNPAFSPDGTRLAFVSGGPRAIRTVPVAGGPVTTVTDSLVDTGGLTWGADGYLYFDGHLEGDGIARVRAEGGAPEVVTRADSAQGESWHVFPELLPNGRGLLYVISLGGVGGRFAIAVLDLKTGARTVLQAGSGPRYAASGHLLYVAGGKLLALAFDQDRLRAAGEPVVVEDSVWGRDGGRTDLAISRTGTLFYVSGAAEAQRAELAWVSRTGGVTPVDTTWRGSFTNIRLSPDGARAAVNVREGVRQDVWITRLNGELPARLTFDGHSSAWAWSPDGRDLILGSGRAQREVVVLRAPADGSGQPARLPALPAGAGLLDLSPDGRWYAFWRNNDIEVMPASGDTTQRLAISTPATELSPRFSPDGRWLAYSSDESGRQEVYVRPFPALASARWQVSLHGGRNPRWAADGRTLYFLDPTPTLRAANVETSPSFRVRSQDSLFPVTAFGGQRGLGASYEPAPDGRRFLMLRSVDAGTGEHQLVVVENFFAMLRKRAS